MGDSARGLLILSPLFLPGQGPCPDPPWTLPLTLTLSRPQDGGAGGLQGCILLSPEPTPHAGDQQGFGHNDPSPLVLETSSVFPSDHVHSTETSHITLWACWRWAGEQAPTRLCSSWCACGGRAVTTGVA